MYYSIGCEGRYTRDMTRYNTICCNTKIVNKTIKCMTTERFLTWVKPMMTLSSHQNIITRESTATITQSTAAITHVHIYFPFCLVLLP